MGGAATLELGYVSELRANARYLGASALGMGFGGNLDRFLLTIFAPFLLTSFGWSRSQFALIGATVGISMIFIPIVGRLADIYGVRRVAVVGVISAPLIDIALCTMSGSFAYFFLLCTLQILLVGATTTTAVYGRLIAENFKKARGLTLSIGASATPLIAAIIAAPLSHFIEAYGWRPGYLVVGTMTATAGSVALALIPGRVRRSTPSVQNRKDGGSASIKTIIRTPAFALIATGMILCNLTLMVQSSQLKLILIDIGSGPRTALWLISIYATGIVAGRLLCGLALDRFPAPIIATIGLGLPGVGLLALAFSGGNLAVVVSAILLIGLSTGAEVDIAAYLVMRYFSTSQYGVVYGLVAAVSAASGTVGALTLSLMLRFDDHYSPFLILSGIVTVVGSSCFLFLKRLAPYQPIEQEFS